MTILQQQNDYSIQNKISMLFDLRKIFWKLGISPNFYDNCISKEYHCCNLKDLRIMSWAIVVEFLRYFFEEKSTTPYRYFCPEHG